MTPVKFDEEVTPLAGASSGNGDDARPNDGGLVGRIRAERQARLADRTRTYSVPGSELLGVRYKPPSYERIPQAVRAGLFGATQEALTADLECLVEACDAIVVRDATDQPWQSLADRLRAEGEQLAAGELRFEHGDVLGRLFDSPPDNELQAVLLLFGNAPTPELGAQEHAARVMEWVIGASQEVDEDVVGESGATERP